MPIYTSPPRHGVSLSDALLEAAAVAPIGRAMLDTLELYHESGTPEGPIYVVNDYADLIATKDAAATRDAGLTVLYMKTSLLIGRAEQSDSQATPELQITVPNVSGVMSQALRVSRSSLRPWELIHRVYASDDTSGPALLPALVLYVSTFDVTAETVTIKASFGDSVNVSIPRLTFKRTEYPGLVR